MNGDHNHYEVLKIAASVLGAVIGGLTVGGRIVSALVAREALHIEAKMLDYAGKRFVSREVIDVQHAELQRRLERIEHRLDELRGRV